jgi:signal transduction histidine kinase
MAAGSLISSLVDNWQIAQYSLLGMPIMLMVIGILMTRYQNMGHNYHGIQINVIILIVLIGSLFLLPQFSVILFQLVLFVILIYVIIIGWQLYQSTKEQAIYQEKLQNLNNELVTTQEKLKALDASKNEFLSFATHQLRSPLTSLKWGLNAVSDGIKDKPDILKIVEQLRETSGNMIETVNDLLDISKIEQGGLVMSSEPVDLVQLLDQLSEEFRITAGTKQLTLSFVTDLPVAIISGDKTKLRQVFVNIIDNAIKYTTVGSVIIILKYDNSDNTFIIDVTDTGPGISPDELNQLFEKFIRGNAGKSSKSGSGLGLYLGKKIIELHHGSITANSSGLGKGSTFSVVLPKL